LSRGDPWLAGNLQGVLVARRRDFEHRGTRIAPAVRGLFEVDERRVARFEAGNFSAQCREFLLGMHGIPAGKNAFDFPVTKSGEVARSGLGARPAASKPGLGAGAARRPHMLHFGDQQLDSAAD